VIENNPNKNLIASMSIKQRFRELKRIKGKENPPPPILVNSNGASFIEEKSTNDATTSFYIS
jgi:hypothetical protein